MAENAKEFTWKKYGKIVPIAVAGFVAASAGTMDAQATEVEDPDIPAAPGEEQKTEAAAPSTDIKDVAYGESTTDEETGGTKKEGTVNVGLDADGTVTNDGKITVTETPGTSGSTSTTVTNEDGSTTTTTTTTTESDVEIEGEVTSGETEATASEEDDEAKEDVEKAIAGKDDIQGVLEKKYGAVDKETSTDGNTVTETYTVNVVETSEKTEKPLTDAELKEVLKVNDLKAVEGKTGTYTYTDETGATVTIQVTDESTETTTTKWTITVKKTTRTVNGKESVTSRPVEDITDSDKSGLSAKDILAKAEAGGFGTDATIETNANGDITKITVGSKTYEFTYTEIEKKVDITGLTSEQILKLLPEGKGYELKDGEIVDICGNVLDFSTTKELLKNDVEISMTMTDTQSGESDSKQYGETSASEAEAAAKTDAIQDAIKNALTAQGTEPNGEATKNTDGTWTVEDKDGKVYTFTISADTTTGTPVAWTVDEITAAEGVTNEDISSGETHTVTGSAVVQDGTVVWTETDGSDTVFLGEDGKVKVQKGDKIGNETVLEVSGDKTTVKTQVTNADGSVTTKTYTFTYELDLTEGELMSFIAAKEIDGIELPTDGLSLKKTIWTVQESTEKAVTDDSVQGTVITSGVTKNGDTYSVEDNGTTVTLTLGADGKYTATKGNAVYTLEKSSLSEDEIKAMIAEKYGVSASDVTINEDATATFTKDGATVTVSYEAAENLTVKKTVTESSSKDILASNTDDAAAQADLIAQIKKVINEKSADEKIYLDKDGSKYELTIDANGNLVGMPTVTGTTTPIYQEELVVWIKANTAINFSEMDKAALIAWLESQQTNDKTGWKHEPQNDSRDSKGHKGPETQHLDLAVEGKIDVGNANGVKSDAILLKDDTLSFVWSTNATDLVMKDAGTELADTLNNTISWDDVGHYEYQHKKSQESLPSNGNKPVYKVSGTVAYGFQTDHEYRNQGTALAALKTYQQTCKTAVLVQVGGKWRIYDNTAPLLVYGYLDEASNCCRLKETVGYDLKLADLTLITDALGEKKVTASGQNVHNYAVKLIKEKVTTSNVASGSSLTLTGETSVTTGMGGSDFFGTYEITKNLNVKGVDAGSGTATYETYKVWTESEATGSATGIRYAGTLNYTYEVPGDPEVKVTGKTVEKNRDVDVKVEKTAGDYPKFCVNLRCGVE